VWRGRDELGGAAANPLNKDAPVKMVMPPPESSR
jgi:hypothetical protein